MQRLKSVLNTITIVLNCMLAFFLVFENFLVLPPWLQVTGRLHPLLTHFPIVLVVILVFDLLRNSTGSRKSLPYYLHDLLLAVALLTVTTAITGLFLSIEDGYDAASLRIHKYSGAALALFFVLIYNYRNEWLAHKKLVLVVAVFSTILLIVAGHAGSEITHGADFIWEPIASGRKTQDVISPDAEIYAHLVRPILEQKCMSCHNTDKAKGQLNMELDKAFNKGGKNGIPWDTTSADLGLLIRRIHLPSDSKQHMPPAGKPQLTSDEIAILEAWIKTGSNFKMKLNQLPSGSALNRIINARTPSGESPESFDFNRADIETITRLTTENRVVSFIDQGSPALSVQFFNRALFKSGQLEELAPVKKQITTLNLAKMPVRDKDLKWVSDMVNLRRLNLSFTEVTGAGLPALSRLQHLQHLTLSGNKIETRDLESLKKISSLKTLELWNTGISKKDQLALTRSMADIALEWGYVPDTVRLQLPSAVILNERSIIDRPTHLEVRHYIPGVQLKYTLDGSEPDSSSMTYSNATRITGDAEVKVKSFKKGWISSPSVNFTFYKSTIQPDSILFLTDPEPEYSGKAALLIDKQKIDRNVKDGNWVAWRFRDAGILLSFDHPEKLKSLTLVSLIDVQRYIVPPRKIEIWAGNEIDKMRVINNVIPEQSKKDDPFSFKNYLLNLPGNEGYRYYKIVAQPLSSLPARHPDKGEKAWFFINEILLN